MWLVQRGWKKKNQSTFTIAWYWFDAIRKNINGRKSLNFFCSFRCEREKKGELSMFFYKVKNRFFFFLFPFYQFFRRTKKKVRKTKSEKWESMKNETHRKLNENTNGNKWKWERNQMRREERTEIHRVKWRVLIEYGRFFFHLLFFLLQHLRARGNSKRVEFSLACSLCVNQRTYVPYLIQWQLKRRSICSKKNLWSFGFSQQILNWPLSTCDSFTYYFHIVNRLKYGQFFIGFHNLIGE